MGEEAGAEAAQLRERQGDLRKASKEATAAKQELKRCQAAARRRRALAMLQRRQLGTCKKMLQNSKQSLQFRKEHGYKLDGARKRVALAQARLIEAHAREVDAVKEMRNATSRKRQAADLVQKSLQKRAKFIDGLKVLKLKLRQQRARQAAQARRMRQLIELSKNHASARAALLRKQRTETQRLEAQIQEDVKKFKAQEAEKARSAKAKQRERAAAFARALRMGEPRHADKFEKACIVRKKGYSNESPLYVLSPKGSKHQYTLVYLHQFNCTSERYAEWRPHYFFSSSKLPGAQLRVLLPTARRLQITAHDCEEKHAWFDYTTDCDGVREDGLDRRSLWEARDRIFAILDREVELLGGDASRVLLGGASQGCCLALHCALSYPKLLGGFLGIVGHLLSCTPVPASKRRLPLRFHNGLDDRVMRWRWVRKTFRRLEAAGFNDVQLRTEAGMGHNTGPMERRWLVDFLGEMLSKSS